jgi:hypothetical protein
MEKLAEIPKQPAVDLRNVAWSLLKLRKHVSDLSLRGELARRALELSQVATRLEQGAASGRGGVFPYGKSSS